jgi:glucose-1-phosphate thymidylyltransferase
MLAEVYRLESSSLPDVVDGERAWSTSCGRRAAAAPSKGLHDAGRGPPGRITAFTMKAVILAGGDGARLHPLTRITNKHLLPIYDRPMVSYAIEAVAKAGIKEVMLVSGGEHAGEFFRLVGNGQEHGIDRLFYALQERPAGIADALAVARRFAGDDHLFVLLADNIFERTLRLSVEAFETQGGGARILLSRVDDLEHLRHLGVAELDAGQLRGVVEKPQRPPSSYAVTGAYFFDPTVWDVLGRLDPSPQGEVEIADVNNHYIRAGAMAYEVLDDFWGDAGESVDAYYAVNDFVRFQGVNKE